MTLLGHRFALDRGDLCGWRPVLQPGVQSVQRGDLACRDDFDAAIRQILGKTSQTELERTRVCRGAEEHALHATGNEEARTRHAQDFLASVAGCELSLIALSRSFPVIGPVKIFATVPSGAIR